VSSSGSQLLINAHGSEAVYVSCLRNFSVIAEYVSSRHKRVAVLGAGTHGQFRREDQYGCALVAERLIKSGFRPESEATTEIVERWSAADLNELRSGRSAAYLERSGQSRDIDFTLSHVDDLRVVPMLVNDEVLVANKDDLVA